MKKIFDKIIFCLYKLKYKFIIVDQSNNVIYQSRNIKLKKLIEYDDEYENMIYKYQNRFYECIDRKVFVNKEKITIRIFNDITSYYTKIIILKKEISKLKKYCSINNT